MQIRKAINNDVNALFDLLATVQALHASGRPDIFKLGATKYTHEHIKDIVNNSLTPVYVLVDEADVVMGYAFCSIMEEKETENLYAKKTFYIDDLCVAKSLRGQGFGRKLYEYVLIKAKEFRCDRLTLNVWHLNASAEKFYQKLGMQPLKTTMETIIK